MKIECINGRYTLCPSPGEEVIINYDPAGVNSTGSESHERTALTVGTLLLPNGRMGLIIQYLENVYESGNAAFVLDDPNRAEELLIQGIRLKRRKE